MTLHSWEEPDPFIEGRMDRMEAEYHAVETAISEAHYYVRVADVKKNRTTLGKIISNVWKINWKLI